MLLHSLKWIEDDELYLHSGVFITIKILKHLQQTCYFSQHSQI